MPTVRQQIFELLSVGWWDSRQLADYFGLQEAEVTAHLHHIAQSATSRGMRLEIRPSGCRQCGFRFRHRQRLDRPGRCPRCRSERIDPPAFTLK